jgi:hypothetical protein
MGILVQNHSKVPPFEKRTCNYFLTSIFYRSNHMIKYMTYICTTGRSFIFYFISTYDIIMIKVAIFFFIELA